MKKYLVVLALMLPLVASAQTFDQNLYFGIQGNSGVKQLQEFLTDQGLYSGPISGNFFSLTLVGVKNFQSREGITPTSGYFGPLTRTKVNNILSQQLSVSDQQAIAETGTSTPPVMASSTMQLQLEALLKQVALMQAQLQVQQSSTQAIQNLQGQVQQQTQTIQQQAQTLQQIQQNTAPTTPAPIVAPIVIPVIKQITFSTNASANTNGIFHNIRVYYSEDGKKVSGQQVILTADDEGDIIAVLPAPNPADGEITVVTQGTSTGYIRSRDNTAHFQYIPKSSGLRTLTFTVGTETLTTQVAGK